MSLSSVAGPLNLIVSTVVVVAGIILFRFRTPAVFGKYPYTRVAFGFWVFQWIGFMFIFATFDAVSGLWLGGLLALVDLQSICALGFFFVFFKGNEFRWRVSVLDLGFIYAFVLVWNLAFLTAANASRPSDVWRRVWIFPSEVLSALALASIALVFILRYRWSATSFAFIVFLYIILQRPIYWAKFVDQHSAPIWVTALSLGKLCLGFLFYTMFFLDAKNYGPLQFQPLRIQGIPLGMTKALNRLVVLSGAVVLHVTAFLISHKVEKWFPFLSS